MKKKILLTLASLSFTALSQCASQTAYVQPVSVNPKASVAEREKLYADNTVNKVEKPPKTLEPFKVGEKYYGLEGIEPIFSTPYTSDKTKGFRSKAATWNTFAGIFGAIGGGALGWNTGVLIGSGSKSAFYYPWLWGVAGGGLVFGYLFGSFAGDNYEKAIASYNEDLKKVVLPEKVTSDFFRYYDQQPVVALSYSHSF